jgi:hypothetical protein
MVVYRGLGAEGDALGPDRIAPAMILEIELDRRSKKPTGRLDLLVFFSGGFFSKTGVFLGPDPGEWTLPEVFAWPDVFPTPHEGPISKSDLLGAKEAANRGDGLP